MGACTGAPLARSHPAYLVRGIALVVFALRTLFELQRASILRSSAGLVLDFAQQLRKGTVKVASIAVRCARSRHERSSAGSEADQAGRGAQRTTRHSIGNKEGPGGVPAQALQLERKCAMPLPA